MKAPILRKETLAPGISRMVLSAPEVAAHAAAGQFIILRPTENGERIPLTISDFDPKAGTVTIVYQVVGGTTLLLDSLRPGDSLPTFTGPLGRPSHIAGFQNAAVIGGGLGCAIALPTAAALHRGDVALCEDIADGRIDAAGDIEFKNISLKEKQTK